VDDLIEEVRFARDSPLEGDGFEPSVPRDVAGSQFHADYPLIGRARQTSESFAADVKSETMAITDS
jgi:hypothetical protein